MSGSIATVPSNCLDLEILMNQQSVANTLNFLFAITALLATPAISETCPDPRFEIQWSGYSDATLLVSASQDDLHLRLTLEYPRDGDWDPISLLFAPSSPCNSEKARPGGVAFCVIASPGGASIPLSIDRRGLLRSGGQLEIQYQSPGCSVRRQSVRAIDKHRLSLDLGTSYILRGDGSWDNHAEAALSRRSQWREHLLLGTDLRYSFLSTDATTTTDANATDPGDQPPLNPLESTAGVLQGDLYLVLGAPFAPRLGLVIGGGFSTLPGSESELETTRRYFTGLRVSVDSYNSGRPGDSLRHASGYLQAGISMDDLWIEAARIFVQGELELPKIGTSWLRSVVRLDISLPASGTGPSDVRVSVLGSVDPAKWIRKNP